LKNKYRKDMNMALTINTLAPDFQTKTDQDITISLTDYRGKWVVLYFYPKDNTSGCTKEACSFNDNISAFNEIDAVVLGVSPDSVKSHVNFKTKFNLKFTLLSDTDKEICKLYDVLGEKSMYGKKYLGVVRTTYIIDPEGNIRWVNPKVSVEGHIQEVIKQLNKLRK